MKQVCIAAAVFAVSVPSFAQTQQKTRPAAAQQTSMTPEEARRQCNQELGIAGQKSIAIAVQQTRDACIQKKLGR